MGRFINADNYPSTGQGLLGNNMFAYCNNNPICLVDYSGESPFGSLTLGDYYIIHKQIQFDCKCKTGWDMEVYVSGSKGIGFLDLYDSTNNQYYEVKSDKAANRSSTSRQMEKYDVALVKDIRYSDPATTPPTRGMQYVTGTVEYGVWDINYRLSSAGLITYTPEYNWNRAGTIAASLLIVGLALFTQGASIPFTAPALGLA